ncbi:hypothetical protein E3G52_000357 [Mycobacteroides abscessus]|uniref:hypothetical protein n=1 Tax=Mycobacteroides abscessus TaxID=36809 RepID=UPI0018789D00|nr:hypothetical protein [Mycobacteroides abscessus]MBE5453493.1 hypothetical protein [Mycobacteroides abscessus]
MTLDSSVIADYLRNNPPHGATPDTYGTWCEAMADVLATAGAHPTTLHEDLGTYTQPNPDDVHGLDPDGRPRSRAYRKLVTDFRTACSQQHNDDGTVGAPCWLCHRAIDYTITDPYHPDVFNADHATPVKERPELAMDVNNLRPSHRDCNLRRGADDAEINIGTTSEPW